jgi:hypothetical protein
VFGLAATAVVAPEECGDVATPPLDFRDAELRSRRRIRCTIAAVGKLVRSRDSQPFPLACEIVIGRSRGADLVLDRSFVSGLHASVVWTADGWAVRDLGSRNGTAVEGRRVGPGDTVRIGLGQAFILGGEPDEEWCLVDDGPPDLFAIDDEGNVVLAEDGMLGLPDNTEPDVTVYSRSGTWWIESGNDNDVVKDRHKIAISGRTWTVRLPVRLDETAGAAPFRISDATFALRRAGPSRVPLLDVTYGDEEFELNLGSAGEVFEMLATARKRDDGWIERARVLHQLRITSNNLNVAVFRLRRTLQNAGFADAADIIERAHGRLRLGVTNVEVA